jgi:hypothetical protein
MFRKDGRIFGAGGSTSKTRTNKCILNMKTINLFLFFFFYSLLYGHKDVVVKQTYSNVIITTTAQDYVEEINKTFIIGQYVEQMLKLHLYNDKIYLYFFENQIDNPNIKVWLPNLTDNSSNLDGINIIFQMHQYNIEGCLKVVENAIINKKNLNQFVNQNLNIYKGIPSNTINEVLKIKFYRPNVIKELEKSNQISYYIQDKKYNLFYVKDEKIKIIAVFDNILDYHVLNNGLIVVFTNIDEFNIIVKDFPVNKKKINNLSTFYRPYKVYLIGENKIFVEFSPFSELNNRVLVYFIENDILIQDFDKFSMKSLSFLKQE